ncbi:MAG: hypothetical protein WDW38_006152 [Sanguina aurantia]
MSRPRAAKAHACGRPRRRDKRPSFSSMLEVLTISVRASTSKSAKHSALAVEYAKKVDIFRRHVAASAVRKAVSLPGSVPGGALGARHMGAGRSLGGDAVRSDYEQQRVFANFAFVRPWSQEESAVFCDRFLEYPKDFRAIASFLPGRSAGQCVAFFYLQQKKDSFDRVRRKQQLKKRRQQLPGRRGQGRRRGGAAAAARQAALAAAGGAGGGGYAAPFTPAAPAGAAAIGGPGGFGSGTGYTATGTPAGFGSPAAAWGGRGGRGGGGSRGRFPSAGQLAGGQLGGHPLAATGMSTAHSSGHLQQFDIGGAEAFGGGVKRDRGSGRGAGAVDRAWGEAEDWTEEDFVGAVRLFGRDFKAIARHLNMRSHNTAKLFYYKHRARLEFDQVMLSRGGAEANGEDDPDYNAEHSPRPVKRRNTKGASAAAAAAAAAADEDMDNQGGEDDETGGQDPRNQYDSEDDGHDQTQQQHGNGPSSAAGSRRQQRQSANAAAAAAAALANADPDLDAHPPATVGASERGYSHSRRKADAAAAADGGGSVFASVGIATAANRTSGYTDNELQQMRLIGPLGLLGAPDDPMGQAGQPSSTPLLLPVGPGSGGPTDLASQRNSGGNNTAANANNNNSSSSLKVPRGRRRRIRRRAERCRPMAAAAAAAIGISSSSTPAQLQQLHQMLLQNGGVLGGFPVSAATMAMLATYAASFPASNGGGGGPRSPSREEHGAGSPSPDADGGMDGRQEGVAVGAGGEEEDAGGGGGSRRVTTVSWTHEERTTFTDVYARVGRNWPRLAEFIPGKNQAQIKTFYHTYRNKLQSEKQDLSTSALLPTSRKARQGVRGEPAPEREDGARPVKRQMTANREGTPQPSVSSQMEWGNTHAYGDPSHSNSGFPGLGGNQHHHHFQQGPNSNGGFAGGLFQHQPHQQQGGHGGGGFQGVGGFQGGVGGVGSVPHAGNANGQGRTASGNFEGLLMQGGGGNGGGGLPGSGEGVGGPMGHGDPHDPAYGQQHAHENGGGGGGMFQAAGTGRGRGSSRGQGG